MMCLVLCVTSIDADDDGDDEDDDDNTHAQHSVVVWSPLVLCPQAFCINLPFELSIQHIRRTRIIKTYFISCGGVRFATSSMRLVSLSMCAIQTEPRRVLRVCECALFAYAACVYESASCRALYIERVCVFAILCSQFTRVFVMTDTLPPSLCSRARMPNR